eukprot:m.1638698 g.1638698  ORF g.1638698 m.1638698 type:complete len:170 (-) comp30040_c0_seq1:193-702(-)
MGDPPKPENVDRGPFALNQTGLNLGARQPAVYDKFYKTRPSLSEMQEAMKRLTGEGALTKEEEAANKEYLKQLTEARLAKTSGNKKRKKEKGKSKKKRDKSKKKKDKKHKKKKDKKSKKEKDHSGPSLPSDDDNDDSSSGSDSTDADSVSESDSERRHKRTKHKHKHSS